MQDNLREELIKQFPAEVVELVEPSGKKFYACPTCKRVVTLNESKCAGCSQVLSWDHIRQEEMVKGVKTATLKFEVAEILIKATAESVRFLTLQKRIMRTFMNVR